MRDFAKRNRAKSPSTTLKKKENLPQSHRGHRGRKPKDEFATESQSAQRNEDEGWQVLGCNRRKDDWRGSRIEARRPTKSGPLLFCGPRGSVEVRITRGTGPSRLRVNKNAYATGVC